MENFQFRLRGVEKLRLRLRDSAAESLRQAQEAKRHLFEQIAQLQTEILEQSIMQGQAASGLIETQRVLDSQRYQLHLQSQIKMIQDKVALIEQECQRRQQTLVERETEVRALEKLRDKQHDQWQQLQSARAQHRLDEWSGYRHWAQSDRTTEKGN